MLHQMSFGVVVAALPLVLIFVVKYTGRGLVVKRPVVLSKLQMPNLVLGVGVFPPLPMKGFKPLENELGSDHRISFLGLQMSFSAEDPVHTG